MVNGRTLNRPFVRSPAGAAADGSPDGRVSERKNGGGELEEPSERRGPTDADGRPESE